MNRLLKSFFGLTLGVAFSLGIAASLNANKNTKVEKAEAADTDLSGFSKIYRFRKPTEYWGDTVYIHIWGSKTASNNTTWPGINISGNMSYNELSQKVYVFATNVTDYTTLLFHNGSGWQTDNTTIGSNTAWQLDSGNSMGTWTPSNQTYYFYDYRNIFGSNVKCYAWQSGGKYQNTSYPGSGMTTVQYGSGQLYSVTLDCAFDEFKIGIGDSANTGDVWINQHRGQCFCWWNTGDSAWSNDLDWVKAHDWIYNTMHVRDISTETTTDTGACRGSSGYYNKAKTAYQNYSAAIKTKMSKDDCWGIAQARFSAWAKANGETASFSGTTLSISSARSFVPFSLSGDNNNTLIVLAAICSLGILSVGAYYFFKKSKKAEE